MIRDDRQQMSVIEVVGIIDQCNTYIESLNTAITHLDGASGYGHDKRVLESIRAKYIETKEYYEMHLGSVTVNIVRRDI